MVNFSVIYLQICIYISGLILENKGMGAVYQKMG